MCRFWGPSMIGPFNGAEKPMKTGSDRADRIEMGEEQIWKIYIQLSKPQRADVKCLLATLMFQESYATKTSGINLTEREREREKSD